MPSVIIHDIRLLTIGAGLVLALIVLQVISVFRDLRSENNAMIMICSDKPLRKSRNWPTQRVSLVGNQFVVDST